MEDVIKKSLLFPNNNLRYMLTELKDKYKNMVIQLKKTLVIYTQKSIKKFSDKYKDM